MQADSSVPRPSGRALRLRFDSPARRLAGLSVLALACMVLFMTINLSGNIRYILAHRGLILATMVLVAFSSGVATLLFQTVTNNRILTPSVMGLEALFILIQTLLIFFIDANGLAMLGTSGQFICEALLLVLFSTFLYRWLLGRVGVNLHRVLLVGLVCGTLFRSISGLLQRLLEPGEFAILQSRIFATFTRAAPEIIALSALAVLVTTVAIWRMRYSLDVIALGRELAMGLGVSWRRRVTLILLLVSLLVALSTALVGPLTFFGLLVANLTYPLIGSHRHQYLLPGVVLTGIITLVGGQVILERGLHMAGTLSVVIELVGGALFLWFLIKKAAV
ncbi:Iron-uptake system permease protein FeuC [Mixta intestinalis]|uniref:Iron-uptake system permease protein FeuC n=2 Tax=Mixta intestinalis TaxID=1615494 RepID=A0A6P1PVE0_9GAMM|nr:Iron-uptake system permease protein FeuC [Mixta intestinalis]